LNEVADTFAEDQTYRIERDLDDGLARALLALRAGGALEPWWDRDSVDHVQVTLAEDEGQVRYDQAALDRDGFRVIASRVGGIEGVGQLGDVIPPRLLPLLGLVVMERPDGTAAGAVHDRLAAALADIAPLAEADVRRDVVRAQYARGSEHGPGVRGYQ